MWIYLTEKTINKLKEIYQPGVRIFLVSKSTEPKLPSTSKGFVRKIDDEGLVYVDWNNGMQTTLNSKIDRFYKLEGQLY